MPNSPTFAARVHVQVMIIHTALISPMMPEQMRPVLQRALVQSLRALGEANGMCVRLWAEYNI